MTDTVKSFDGHDMQIEVSTGHIEVKPRRRGFPNIFRVHEAEANIHDITLDVNHPPDLEQELREVDQDGIQFFMDSSTELTVWGTDPSYLSDRGLATIESDIRNAICEAYEDYIREEYGHDITAEIDVDVVWRDSQ